MRIKKDLRNERRENFETVNYLENDAIGKRGLDIDNIVLSDI